MGKSYTTTGINISFKSTAGSVAVNTGGSSFIVYDSEEAKAIEVNHSLPQQVNLTNTYVGNTLTVREVSGGTPTTNGTILNVNVDDGLRMSDGKPISIRGTTAPGAVTGTNLATLYVDVSGGKHRLMAKFDTGTAVLLATEP